MEVDTKNPLGGQFAWVRVTQKQANVDKSTLSRVRHRKEGFSAKSARKAAAVSGESPVGVFAASQAHSIQKRCDAGELDSGQVLGAVGRTFTALKTKFDQDQVDLENDQLFANSIQLLQQLGEEASKIGATTNNQMDALGPPGSGGCEKMRFS